jgi:hypothetical protein
MALFANLLYVIDVRSFKRVPDASPTPPRFSGHSEKTLICPLLIHDLRPSWREWTRMVGLLVRHEQYGEGRVIAKEPTTLKVRFFGQNGNPLIQEFGPDALKRGFLKRLNLESGRVCRGPDGPCVVKQLLNASPSALQTYEIEYENGVSNTTSEAELEPHAKSHNNKPAYRLAERDLDNLVWFGCRESLRIARSEASK